MQVSAALVPLPAAALFLMGQAPPRRHVSKVWVADQGDGTYKNPIGYADYDWFRVEK